jgi:23S rRNA (cytidine1920-2'-O)/16S rRNA (cytidine1409-2'-O)-methyltransferase
VPRARLDVALVEQGLAESRARAQALVLAGQVTIDGQPAQKPGQPIRPEAVLAVRQPEPYVGRGGYKLAHALDQFKLDVNGLLAVDVGASTGGFTDVLLQRGAGRVYAVDVGHGQLHWRLRTDPRVVVLDRVNARYLTELPELVNLATVDVSFISLRLILPPLRRVLTPGSTIIALVKPQFEAGRAEVGSGGVVHSAAVHRRVLEDLLHWLPTQQLRLGDLTTSPIRGAAGNLEFLALVTAGEGSIEPGAALVEQALAQAHPTDRE